VARAERLDAVQEALQDMQDVQHGGEKGEAGLLSEVTSERERGKAYLLLEQGQLQRRLSVLARSS